MTTEYRHKFGQSKPLHKTLLPIKNNECFRTDTLVTYRITTTIPDSNDMSVFLLILCVILFQNAKVCLT